MSKRIGGRVSEVGLALCWAIWTGTAGAEPIAPARVPDPLRPWVEWALHGRERERCPFLHGSTQARECAWPARLELAVNERRGTFAQRWRAYSEAWAPLPGDSRLWPQAVRVDGRPAPVVDRNGRPSVLLPSGTHEVRGELFWDAPPELLQIPAETGLLSLSQHGEPVAFPKRDAHGQLWLRGGGNGDASAESRLEITVHRRVVDEIPLQITTRIRLEVSGPAREVVLGHALPGGAIPLSRTPRTRLVSRLARTGRGRPTRRRA